MSKIEKICVYCGSHAGREPAFVEAAKQFGAHLARAGIGLVYGGGRRGLMGAVAQAVLANGGTVTGIIPKFLIDKERMLESAQELIVVPDMHARKRLMFEKADAFVALPGGIGTLEELVEQMTWVQLDRHAKPVLIADIGGFWRPLLDLLAHMRDYGFIPPASDVPYLVADRIEDILPMLAQAIAQAPEAERGRALGAAL